MTKILHYLHVFGKEKKIQAGEKGVFCYANEIFKNAISGTSWCLYIIAVLLIASCLSYLYFERKRRRTNQERMREMQHLIERPPPKRRPGAAAREREVFRNVLKTAHTYIYPNDESKKYIIRQTRSGTIYGKFMDGNCNKSEN